MVKKVKKSNSSKTLIRVKKATTKKPSKKAIKELLAEIAAI